MTHEVRLEVFEGPIDLLLHLITRQRVDIYEVSLASITEEYLAALAAAEDLDLETATGFLVVAAALLELKSARLLPGPGMDSDLEAALEQRDLLLARLVECATFRDAGAWIWRRLEEGLSFHARDAGMEEPYASLTPDILARTAPEDLARAAALVLAPRPEPRLDVSHVNPIRATVREAIETVAARLSTRTEASFEELCADAAETIEVVVRFLALLELFKAGAIDIEQADRFGSIKARWTGEADVSIVLESAEEYAAHD